MKNALVVVAAFLLVASCQTGPHGTGQIEGASMKDFLVLNRGSAAITEIYIRPSGSKGWSDDIIDSDVLPAEQYMMLAPSEVDICLWDVRFVDAVGHEEVDREVDLCSGQSIIFDGGS